MFCFRLCSRHTLTPTLVCLPPQPSSLCLLCPSPFSCCHTIPLSPPLTFPCSCPWFSSSVLFLQPSLLLQCLPMHYWSTHLLLILSLHSAFSCPSQLFGLLSSKNNGDESNSTLIPASLLLPFPTSPFSTCSSALLIILKQFLLPQINSDEECNQDTPLNSILEPTMASKGMRSLIYCVESHSSKVLQKLFSKTNLLKEKANKENKTQKYQVISL